MYGHAVVAQVIVSTILRVWDTVVFLGQVAVYGP